MKIRQIIKSLRGLNIRMKLIGAFALLVLMIAGAGSSGLFFVSLIRGNVDTIYDIAAPLSTLSNSLAKDLLKSNTLIFDILASSDKEQIQADKAQLAIYQTVFEKNLAQLEKVLLQGKIQLDIKGMVQAENNFFIQSEEAIQAHLIMLDQEMAKETNLNNFDQQCKDFDQTLNVFVRSAQIAIGDREEEGQKMLMDDSTTPKQAIGLLMEMFKKDFPVLYRAGELSIFLTQLQDITNEYVVQIGHENLPEIETQFNDLSKKITGRLKRLKRRLRTDEHKASHQHVTIGFEALKNSVVSEQGIFALHRDYLKAGATIMGLSDQLVNATTHVNVALDKILKSSEKIDKTIRQSTKTGVSSAMFYIGMIICGGVIVGVVAAFLIIRIITTVIGKISHDIKTGALQVSSTSEQINETGLSLTEGSSQQAASIEETSASMEQMASMTKKNAENAKNADQLMADARQVVNTANASMEKLILSMEDISKASNDTSNIVKAIDEIAFQTNLLALNAAVEAARAGEAGASFAVVADEVRNLSRRAADAAKDTSNLIEETLNKVDNGSGLVATTNEAFKEVAQSTRKVGELVAEISQASMEQSEGIEQVNISIAELDTVVQQNASNAEESNLASRKMNDQAGQLKQLANDLAIFVNGKKEKHLNASESPNSVKVIESIHLEISDKAFD